MLSRTYGILTFRKVFTASLLTFVVGCSNAEVRDDESKNPFVPAVTENEPPVLHTAPLPKYDLDGDKIILPGGGVIPVTVKKGIRYIPVEMALNERSFTSIVSSLSSQGIVKAEQLGRIQVELSDVVNDISKEMKIFSPQFFPEVGYATGLVRQVDYERIAKKNLILTRGVLLNPRVATPMDENAVRKLSQESSVLNPRNDSEAFSGLARMGEPEFVALTEKEISQKVDGSSVKVGVSDTGITLNHPTFYNAKGESRIQYMKDFTREGRVYFNPEARFEVIGVEGEDKVLVTAQYLEPQTESQEAPVADKMSLVEKLPMLVSAELKTLLTSNVGARLGVLSESSFYNKDGDKVDLNKNGKVKDNFFALLVPDEKTKSYKVYLDLSAMSDTAGGLTADFRESRSVGDWNKTKQTITSYSEKFGFDIKKDVLEDSNEKKVEVVSASIVGFDPGNHGSHVAGIIAGRKTISNDKDTTLARGVAPNASLMMARVCANTGGCTALESIIDLSKNGAEVLNMSLGGLSPFNDGYGVQETVINRLTYLYNTLFIISAGNSGPGRQTVGSPSTARYALSVAATATQSLIERQYQWPGNQKAPKLNPAEDFLLFFSSRGPTAAGGFKPNISAPGTELSSIQLNASPGEREGLDVYWGTSMAAPAAAGAAALLIDAAKKYNIENPLSQLPLDALTLRRAIVQSARPFDVSTFDPKTGKSTKGKYTWIDQGTGMINLPRAWEVLKQARDSRLPGAVTVVDKGVSKKVDLDYQAIVFRKNPNGLNYDGSEQAPTDSSGGKEPKYGTGIWLDANDTDSIVKVAVIRSLPPTLVNRSDVGELAVQLNTTKDEFEFETIYYGAHKEWLKIGTRSQVDCMSSPTERLTVIGQGANVKAAHTKDPSMLNVCLNRKLMSTFAPGDHGAIIHGYRVVDGAKEAHAAFQIPVFMTVSHKTMAGKAGYEVTGTVNSFMVERNYIHVPEGTSLLDVTLTVPAAQVNGSVVKGCGSVELMALEAANTVKPPEIASRAKAVVASCNPDTGRPTADDARTIRFTRVNPKAGIWDLHVFGRYHFPQSDYKLSVKYAKVKSSVEKIVGTKAALTGEFNFEVLESSFDATPDSEQSAVELHGLIHKARYSVEQDKVLLVPNASEKAYRSYAENVSSVTYSTDGSPGNDIDLVVYECTEADKEESCKRLGDSGNASDVEKVVFVPKKDKFYAAAVAGYEMSKGNEFDFSETTTFSAAEKGQVTVVPVSDLVYTIQHTFDVEKGILLNLPQFLNKQNKIIGDIVVRTKIRSVITRIPIEITAE